MPVADDASAREPLLTGLDYNFHDAYNQQWSLSMERVIFRPGWPRRWCIARHGAGHPVGRLRALELAVARNGAAHGEVVGGRQLVIDARGRLRTALVSGQPLYTSPNIVNPFYLADSPAESEPRQRALCAGHRFLTVRRTAPAT